MAWIIAIEDEQRTHMRILRKTLRDMINPFDVPVLR